MNTTTIAPGHVTQILVAVFLICIPSGAAAGEIPSIEELMDRMRGFGQRLEGKEEWLFEYDHNREYHALPPGFSPNLGSSRVTNARKGDWRFLLHQVEREKALPLRTWSLWKDDVSIERTSGTYQIRSNISPNLIQRTFYLNYLFVNVQPKREFTSDLFAKAFSGKSPYDAFPNALPDSVERNKSKYVVRAELDEVGGDRCVVLEWKDRDVIWIDLSHGGICRRRREYFSTGKLSTEYENLDLKEYESGLWLPQRQVVTRYNGEDTPSELQGKVRYIERNFLRSISFADVPAALFEVPKPDSGVVIDHIRGTTKLLRKPPSPPAPSPPGVPGGEGR